MSPHIDTHSAFEGSIFSLSLAGPCVMEFRKYSTGVWLTNSESICDGEMQNSDKTSNFLRRAIHLPPRSMLLLSGEARYAWHHYIPHHKVNFAIKVSRLIEFCLIPLHIHLKKKIKLYSTMHCILPSTICLFVFIFFLASSFVNVCFAVFYSNQ